MPSNSPPLAAADVFGLVSKITELTDEGQTNGDMKYFGLNVYWEAKESSDDKGQALHLSYSL